MDDDVKKLLRQATGINDDDVTSSSGKKDITLFNAYTLAVHNTERLAIEGENSIQAQERKLQAIETFFPYFSLRANKVFPTANSKYTAQTRSAASLYLRQPIITGLKEVSQIKSSLSNNKIRQYELYNSAGLLLADVASSFYNVLLLERDLVNNEQLLDLYVKTVNELKRRVDIGRSRQSEILRTNTQIYKLQADIKSLRNSLAHAKLILTTLTGVESDVKLVDSITLKEPSYTVSDVDTLTGNRWDVNAAKEQVEFAKAGILSACGQHLPSLYLEGSYYLYQEQAKTPLSIKSFQASSSATSILFSYYTKTKPRDYYFSLGAEMPIFGGDITFAKVREANSIKRQSELNYLQTVRLARQDIIDSIQTWESSKVELEGYRKALASAENNYKVVTGEYRLNLVTILDVLTTLTALQTAKEDYDRALLQFKLNRIRVGVATLEFSGGKISLLRSSNE